MLLKLDSRSGNFVRIILALGLVGVAFWWPEFYIRYRIPPCDDDRSGGVIIGGLPYVFAGLFCGMFGLVSVMRAVSSASTENKTRLRIIAVALFIPTAVAGLYLLITIGPVDVLRLIYWQVF